jgi:drug/metabolite transporter (DMT)-like permease
VNPLIAFFMGNLLAQEPLTPQILAAAAIIVSAVAIINFDRRRDQKPVVDYSATPCED